MPTKEQVIEIIKQCYDPEIPVNIWDLGLIYDIEVKPQTQTIAIRMSLTSQHCPAAQSLPDTVKFKIMNAFKIKDVHVQVVFDPPWTPERISEEGKKKLGLLEE